MKPISSHFESGQVRITLPQTDFDPAIENQHINDRFLKYTRFYKEGKNSILEIYFSNSGFQAVGKVRIQPDENTLNIYIDKNQVTDNNIFNTKVLTSELPKEEQKQPLSSFSGDLLKSDSITVSIIKMLLVLSGLLAFLYALLWTYNRFFVSKFNFKRGDHHIKLISSYHISPKQKVIILAVDNRTFACGVTSNNISVISEVLDNSFQSFISRFEYDSEKKIDFAKLRTQYLESKKPENQDYATRGKQSFANELLKRVKGLKPID
ncbi:flagellar biosynthetic protein FliO [bacterium]|nr:flagellar biosynthetic protein FliO [bacterium]